VTHGKTIGATEDQFGDQHMVALRHKQLRT
jgi:hypothetical protein